MRLKRLLKIGVVVLTVLVCLGGVAVGGILLFIRHSVKENIQIAQEAYPHPGDDVGALIMYMNSDEHSLRERNLAVWAMGRLRDPAALEALKANYTGKGCDHEKRLCEGELAKAIVLCGGDI